MKTNLLTIAFLCVIFMTSCELDNFDGPDSKFHGGILDSETNELIQQDLIEGSEISYLELGWDYENPTYLRFHAAGTFRNDLMFAGDYEVQPVRGNFHPVDKEVIKIKGDTEHFFKSLPYIRIKDTKIVIEGEKAIATFKLEQVGDAKGKPVSSIILCCDMTFSVGYPISTGGRTEENPNVITDPNTVYTLELPLKKDNIKQNGEYFFRVGAKIGDIDQAKHNYSEAVRLQVNLY